MKRIIQKNKQFILYCIIGGSSLVLDVVLFLVLFNWWGMNYNLANVLAIFVAINWSFYWNYNYNFGTKDNLLYRYIGFVAVCSGGILLSLASAWIMIEKMQINPNIAKIITLPLVFVFQFTLNKLITFRKNKYINQEIEDAGVII